MEIRKATDGDIPAIVRLLKSSLGESLMPKSEAFWHWKHVQNPFGRSPVLVAWDNGTLVGVRAFMRWEWNGDGRIQKAVRAVDTATHPDYQGKGIFRKLTMQLVEECRDEGVDFIFNTPNKLSKPGYLKMGWRSLGKLPVTVRPLLTFGGPEDMSSFSFDANILGGIGDAFPPGTTHYSRKYVEWRYGNNPNIKYCSFAGERYAGIFRLKPLRWGTEFRICDVFPRFPDLRAPLWQDVSNIARRAGAWIVTSAGGHAGALSIARLPIGPEVTVRPLGGLVNNFLSFERWKPSLGDLEVF